MTNYPTKLPGRIYKRRNKRPDGGTLDHTTWTVRYKGRDYSTGESDGKKAEKYLLAVISGQDPKKAEKGAPPWTRALAETVVTDGVLMSEVLDLFIEDSERRKLASASGNKGIVTNYLRPFFGTIPASSLTTRLFNRYRDLRIESEKEPTPATVNREMAALKRALNYCMKELDPPLLSRYPKITMLKESDPRQGFVTHEHYVRLKSALPDYMVPLFVAGYHVGRRRQELLEIEHGEVDLGAAVPNFRVYPDAAKNGKGSVVPVYGEMLPVFREQIASTKRNFPGCRLLFHKNGHPIQKNEAFYGAWEKACALVGLEGMLFHDLRRTACKMLIDAGNSRQEAMLITGHLTESAFNRYHIMDQKTIDTAAQRAAVFIANQQAAVENGVLVS